MIHRYGLSIALALLFLASWVLQFWTGYEHFVAEQLDHGQTPQMGDYLWEFGQATFENWQSEFLQLLTFVVLTAHLIHEGSHESKDSSDRLEGKVDELLRRTDGQQEEPSGVRRQEAPATAPGSEGDRDA